MFSCSEKLIKAMADRMAKDGYLAAGYQYIALDDCWMAPNRTSDGKLQADKYRFPSGIKNLADYVRIRKSVLYMTIHVYAKNELGIDFLVV